MENLKILALKSLEHPIAAIALLFLIYFLSQFFNDNIIKNKWRMPAHKTSILVSCLILINYIFLLCFYTFHSNFFEHIEPNVAAVSWLFNIGKSVYTDPESPYLYSLPYGPMLYVINGFFLNLIGPSISAAKLAGTLAGALSVAFIFYTLKQIVGYKRAMIYSAYLTLVFISINKVFLAATFWTRSESLLLMLVSLGLLGSVQTNSLIATLLCALSLGVSLNLKIYAILYFLPIYVLLYCQYGIYYTIASSIGAVTIAIAPFLFLPQISFKNYIFWISVIGKQGFSISVLRENIEWILYLAAPAILAIIYLKFIEKENFKNLIQENKKYIYSLLLSSIAISIMGSINGGGMYYLVPLIPLFYYSFAKVIEKQNTFKNEFIQKNINKYLYGGFFSLVIALLSFTILKSAINESRLIVLSQKYATPVINDIQKIINIHPGTTIGMGYGSHYDLSFYRPVLVFYGNPYLVDAATLMSWEQSGHNIPSKTLTELNSCQIKIWLIPKGDAPFELFNFMTHKLVFDRKFRENFLKNYLLKEQSQYYDLWVCKKDI